jgi:hypothetical protein
MPTSDQCSLPTPIDGRDSYRESSLPDTMGSGRGLRREPDVGPVLGRTFQETVSRTSALVHLREVLPNVLWQA